MTIKFLSLFAGVGGFDVGFERSGMECIATVEIDEFCRDTLKKNWPDVKQYNDVTKFCRRIGDCQPEDEDGVVLCPRCDMEFGDCECIGTDQFTDECGYPDLICGGFPCQDISHAGKQAGINDGERSSLFGEIIRIADQLRPKYLVLENVPALLSGKDYHTDGWTQWCDCGWRGKFIKAIEGYDHDDERYEFFTVCPSCGGPMARDTTQHVLSTWFGTVLSELAACGYDAQWDCLPAYAVGAPHARDRVFVVAVIRDPNQEGESVMPFDAETPWMQRNAANAERLRRESGA